METNTEKSSLRKVLLERRDITSYDFIKLASQKIHNRLKQVEIFSSAKKIGCYYPIGSEVLTQNIMQELLGDGKEISLPKVVGDWIHAKRFVRVSQSYSGNALAFRV